MFDFLKRKKIDETVNPISSSPEKTNLFGRLKKGLSKTRHQFSEGLSRLFLGKKELDQTLLDDIEMLLLSADVGVATTEHFIQLLTQKLARKELNSAQAAFDLLKQEMKNILKESEVPLNIPKSDHPFVILVVGVNGSGKTTTIGKLAHYFQNQDYKILLAAGDTFRAAAIEQLQVWGRRNHVPVIAQLPGADTAAVIFDAFQSAQSKGCDLLIADTAGRLHTQSNLMAELQKIKRVLSKQDPGAPHEVLIVLDAALGQNALNQVKQFHEALGVTGIVLTKLDGTAKGGIIFSIAKQTKLPIRFIGLGEQQEDLRPFNANDFVEALFSAE